MCYLPGTYICYTGQNQIFAFVFLKGCRASFIISTLLLSTAGAGSSCLAFSFCPRTSGLSPRLPFILHSRLRTFSFYGRQLKCPPPLYLPPFKKVIVICTRKSWSIDIYGTSLLGPSALLLLHRPHRSLRCRLHLLCILIIMAHPLTEELILASI